jgi:NADPH2:quinone reductase
MRAAWYEHRGDPRESLVVGEMPDPVPGDGEVRIAITVSGISPGDVKKRAGRQNSPMPFPRVIPHSDGAGVIDEVGPGVDVSRVGSRAWCYGAQSYRAFGTAAEYVIVPDGLAVSLPLESGEALAHEIDEQASCLGIPGITGHRAVFADGSVNGLVVVIFGAAGGVGSIAAQLARRDGARVIAVVRNEDQKARVKRMGLKAVFFGDDPILSERILKLAPNGVHRIAEVDFGAHIDLDATILAVGGVVSSYFSSSDRPDLPYWTLGFKDITLRLLGSDDFAPAVKVEAARMLTDALVTGNLRSDIVASFPLEDIASAHELVESGPPGRVMIDLMR